MERDSPSEPMGLCYGTSSYFLKAFDDATSVRLGCRIWRSPDDLDSFWRDVLSTAELQFPSAGVLQQDVNVLLTENPWNDYSRVALCVLDVVVKPALCTCVNVDDNCY